MTTTRKSSIKRALMWGGAFAGMYLIYFSFSQGFSLNLLAYALLGGILFGALFLVFIRLLMLVFKALGGKVEE